MSDVTHATQTKVRCPVCLEEHTEFLPSKGDAPPVIGPASRRIARHWKVHALHQTPGPAVCGRCWARHADLALVVDTFSARFQEHPNVKKPEGGRTWKKKQSA